MIAAERGRIVHGSVHGLPLLEARDSQHGRRSQESVLSLGRVSK